MLLGLAASFRPFVLCSSSVARCETWESSRHPRHLHWPALHIRKLTASHLTMIRFILVQNRQGKTRLSKFYVPYDDQEKIRLRGEVHRLIAPRDQKYQSNFVEVSLLGCIVHRVGSARY